MKILSGNKITIHYLILFIICNIAQNVHAIVNMDGLHFSKKEDVFSANLDLRVSGSSGNSNTSQAAFDSQLSWKSEESINLVIFGLKYGENNDVRNMNNAFMHYRFIHKLNNTTDWELFTQLEENEFTRLSYRGLLGAGLRFDVLQSEDHQAFLGLGGFYSKEKIDYRDGLTDHGTYTYTRANLYFLSKYKISSNMSWSNVLYYQPRFNLPSDYRALFKTKLDFKINDSLGFRLSLDVAKDSEPSQTIKSTDTTYMTGLTFKY